MAGIPTATWATYGAVVAGLVAIHLIATGGSWTLSQAAQDRIGITPARTLADGVRHLWAGFFHTTPGHIAFNLLVFSAAFPFAAGASPVRSFAVAYLIGPLSVLTLHLTVVRPLAATGFPYAVQAMERSLVGFSVIAYATLGMAIAVLALRQPVAALVASGIVVAFELVVGLSGTTGPFIFVYHLVGFGVGWAVRSFAPRLMGVN
ncbi:MAG: hypothetical protein AABX89_07215 [Candidatus Thermoplasmatota archaeon]